MSFSFSWLPLLREKLGSTTIAEMNLSDEETPEEHQKQLLQGLLKRYKT